MISHFNIAYFSIKKKIIENEGMIGEEGAKKTTKDGEWISEEMVVEEWGEDGGLRVGGEQWVYYV